MAKTIGPAVVGQRPGVKGKEALRRFETGRGLKEHVLLNEIGPEIGCQFNKPGLKWREVGHPFNPESPNSCLLCVAKLEKLERDGG